MGSAAEFPYYPWEAKVPRPGGLGRFSSGVWEFPVTLPKVAQDERPESPYGLFLYGTGPETMVGVGDKLFFADPTGLYVGPREWRRILSGPWLAIEPSEDGQGLSIIRAVPGGDPSGQNEVQRGQYETDGGEVAFETVKAESTGWERWDRLRSLLDRPAGASWAGEWVRVPAAKEGIWAVGLLSSAHHVVVETSAAVWIASPGELIRLDRRLLKDWLGK
jgi:hypothetical protein